MSTKLKLGYVVYISNPLNFDIDIINSNYEAIKNKYEYVLPDDEKVKESYAYRCRVKDIKMKGGNSKYYSREDCRSFRDIIKHINSLDGWVHVMVHEIDAHQRLIVDLIDPVTGKNIIAQHLLNGKGSYYEYNWS
jgi:hypothetical protein